MKYFFILASIFITVTANGFFPPKIVATKTSLLYYPSNLFDFKGQFGVESKINEKKSNIQLFSFSYIADKYSANRHRIVTSYEFGDKVYSSKQSLQYIEQNIFKVSPDFLIDQNSTNIYKAQLSWTKSIGIEKQLVDDIFIGLQGNLFSISGVIDYSTSGQYGVKVDYSIMNQFSTFIKVNL
jgi:hypothetical protein